MHLRGFMKAGHWPTLLCAFLYFDISFMIWTLPGGLANSIGPEFKLNSFEWGLMLAIPILSGSLLRLVLGPLADHIGARRTGMLGLARKMQMDDLVPRVLQCCPPAGQASTPGDGGTARS